MTVAGAGEPVADNIAGGHVERENGTAAQRLGGCLIRFLALNRSVHRLVQVSWLLAPEDGVGSVVEVVEQVLDLWAGVQRSVAVVFLVRVAPIQRP